MRSNTLTNWFYTTNQIIAKDSDTKPTHLLLDGGHVKIKDNLIDTFYKLYAECVDNKIPLHIVEHKTELFKFFSDLDFINKDEMTQDELVKIVHTIQEALYYMFEKNHSVIVCTTDKKITIKESTEYIKQGVHLYWPTLIVNLENSMLIRGLIIHKLKTTFGERESINIWDDVVDLSVYKTNGIRMIGSSKCSYDRSNGKTEFIDDKRLYMPSLIIDMHKQILSEELSKLLANTHNMIVTTSIRLTSGELSSIVNIPEFLKLPPVTECEECEEPSSKRVNSSSLTYQEIIRFFRIHVKNYSADDIKKILNFDDKVYIILTKSKYCQNIDRSHNSCQIYFKLSKEGICQKCHCICNTMAGRKYGYCKDYASEYIKCTEHLLKLLNWSGGKSKEINKIDLPNISQMSSGNCTVDDFRLQLYNKFTNKSPPKQRPRKKTSK